MQIHSKLPAAGTTIFTVMSQLATEHNAVNLGQGFPDYSMSEELFSLVNQAMRNGFNQYTHMNGLPLLRERLAEKAANLYNTTINPDTQITITPGGTQFRQWATKRLNEYIRKGFTMDDECLKNLGSHINIS